MRLPIENHHRYLWIMNGERKSDLHTPLTPPLLLLARLAPDVSPGPGPHAWGPPLGGAGCRISHVRLAVLCAMLNN